ncbi:hypothetical protein ARC20_02025 [Stenotrophomonas panacihumi]|uniref:DUF4175 domain-containing protein n=1 Tax=Stenotrophomonas panacihumi TaxID=676599 RepID=A0A0Q9ZXR6_9GAMM|nr:hypothetical protein [Stenotrophomonas panacihumi]KRG37693.1 hypothetical protein ARC20_02025 [Stenotrophomonas panacihumi]PTN56133.1 hypothetical protein C9J98_02345 [Stenotrophomonas panacihumi]
MSVALLRSRWAAARRRRRLTVFAFGWPWALLPVVMAWRWQAGPIVWPALLVGGLVLAACAVLWSRRLDLTWLRRRLDAEPALEDSADLLFADAATLGPLQQLQRDRVEARLASNARDLREPWPWKRGVPVLLVGVLALAAVIGWPARAPASPPPSAMHDDAARAREQARLRHATLQATPPAYTDQPAGALPTLDAKVPQGTRLAWTLQFDHPPREVQLRLTDGRTIPLALQGDRATGTLVLERPLLYRIVLDGQPLALHRLEPVPDRAPQVRVLEPEASLVEWQPARKRWTLRFEASDDYAVAASAPLRLTLAQGSGENIRFSEHGVTLNGSGSARLRRFEYTLDPTALGMQPGDDLVAQLEVRDNHPPTPQTARSGSVILRWPSPQQQAGVELEASVRKTLPAYFRSQRQIIIDAEALLKDKRKLDAETFLKRSDAIGVDQRILRLRYGQFLGEESEGAPKLPTHDDDAVPTSDVPTSDAPTSDIPTADAPAPEKHADAAQGAAALDDHDHDHAPTGDAPGFGNEGNVLAEFGHTHDHAEAATLLDPKTRATLKAALDQMWQAEGELRQGRPDAALPYAYKALGFIKEVQQAERIYLARLGPELPPIDMTRRLGGDRAGLARRDDALAPWRDEDTKDALALWTALAPAAGEVPAARLDAFARWLGTHENALASPLDLAAALEQYRAEPSCAECRERLRALLWTTLAAPPARPLPRQAPDATGRRYLDALSAGDSP